MKFPAINKQARRRVSIPQLSGGLNFRDGISQCNDNQLTDMLNMWYKDGLLKTRPGTKTIDMIAMVGYDVTTHPIQTDIFLDEHRLFCCVVSGSRKASDGISTITFAETVFWLQGKEEIKKLPTISKAINFVSLKNSVLYSFTSDRNIYKLDYKNNTTAWVLVQENEYYIPLVFYHCKNQSVSLLGDSGGLPYLSKVTYKATQLEDYNLLSSYYQMVYSTYSEAVEKNYMVFNLGCDLPTIDNGGNKGDTYHIKAEYTDISGIKYTHSVTWTVGDYSVMESDAPGGLKMFVDGALNRIVFYSKGEGNFDEFAEEIYRLEDNLIITAPCVFPDKEKNKIFNMTNAVWYGGYATGLVSGTRLFLCGNTEAENKALVCWSGLNDPLYFPEKSCCNVGDTSEAVTAFGKQENTLVIFKEKEAWYTVYKQNETINTDDLINQRVLDLQTSSVYFPLTQIHSTIGCKYPDTVQLCRNRLVWLGSDNRVYTLTNQNQYSERNIYCVSDMINNVLKNEMLDGAFAADWEGHYLLFVNNHVYAMDYNSYGYTHIYSYTKTEDAQIKIPWWYWEFEASETPINSNLFENDLYIVFYPKVNNGYLSEGFKIKKLSKDLGFDEDKTIFSFVQTKLFDFNEGNAYKDISSVGFSLGYNDCNEIIICFVTDVGEEQHTIILEDAANERQAPFLKSTVLTPTISSILRFGIKIECRGKMTIDGITIDYRILGRAK